jgi:hypothetical protein
MQNQSFYKVAKHIGLGALIFLVAICEISELWENRKLYLSGHWSALWMPLTCLIPAVVIVAFRRLVNDYTKRGQIAYPMADFVLTWAYLAVGFCYVQIIDLISNLHRRC